MKTKVCRVCKIEKPIEEFARHRRRKDGRDNVCKKCAAERVRQWRIKNKEYYTEYNKEYYKRTKEKQLKNSKEYYKSNKEIILKKSKEYYSENKESKKRYVKNYKKTSNGKIIHINSNAKRRTREKNGNVTKEEIMDLINKTNKCPLCGIELTENNRQLDHIIPLNIGGEHTIKNIRFICKNCNLHRPKDGRDIFSDKTLSEEIINEYKNLLTQQKK